MLSGWTSHRHLWVRGDLGIPPERLAELEDWLDGNGPNWTVVLMENARHQSWGGARGMDAVEEALGVGLNNRTGFSELVDPRTGERNGAILVIFLEERKFSYFGSDTFDRRGLGEDRWIGHLDRPALSAMRQGGRTADAVRDTVIRIESDLTRLLAEEEERRRLAQIARAQAVSEATALPARILARIAEAEERATRLRQKHEALTGPVVQPESGAWAAAAGAVKALATETSHPKALELGRSTLASIEAFVVGLDRWERAPAEWDRIAAELDRLELPAEVPSVRGPHSAARAALESARSNHRIGDPLYQEQLDRAAQSLGELRAALERWHRDRAEAERLVRLRRLALGIAALLSVLLAAAALRVANRLRRPYKHAAEKAHRHWKEQLRGKFDRLFGWMDRTGLLVGNARTAAERGHTGITASLAREAIRSVDELFIMSAATDRVMDGVAALLEPSSPWARLGNLFSGKRYREALDRLGSQPIGFDDSDQLEAILRPRGDRERPTRTLLGDPGDYEPFRLSFEQLIAEYDQREERVAARIERLASGVDGWPLLADELEEPLARLHEAARSLRDLSREDGWFELGSLGEVLLPAIERHFAEARNLGRTDPVAAREEPGERTRRQVEEATELVSRLERLRSVDFPAVEAAVAILEREGRNPAWVDRRFAELSERADQLASRAAEQSIATDLPGFDAELEAARVRVGACATLASSCSREHEPRLVAARQSVALAKGELAARLGLSAEEVLEETDLSPGRRLDLAGRQLDSARAALDHGNLEGAREDLDEMEQSLSESAELVRLSRASLDEHASRHPDLAAEHRRLLEDLPAGTALLDELKAGYEEAVLFFSSRLGREIPGQASVRDSIGLAAKAAAAAASELAEADAAHRRGALIAAARLLDGAEDHLEEADRQLDLVRDQHAALREAERDNPERVDRLFGELADLHPGLQDRRTCRNTIDRAGEIRLDLTEHQKALQGFHPDPFALFHQLTDLSSELARLRDGIVGDHRRHEAAVSTLSRARAALASSREWMSRAEEDGVTDSAALTRALTRHAELVKVLEDEAGKLGGDHLDWGPIARRGAEVTTEALALLAVIRDEVLAAENAVRQIRGALEGTGWLQAFRSAHSVEVDRTVGSAAIEEAVRLLGEGLYERALEAATRAVRSTDAERQRALARERELQRAAEAARAAQLAARRASQRSSSRSSSSSRSRSGSGFSRSSFSSGSRSRSGFSRSGW